ncbi:hypothetical protein POM88_034686 [Heracleum sosnowskyi]|uniref:Uncharacterized protein n=1 Tax=Heracleum sosnowskyi TaxID=360622 RepID=A0AAD8HLM9_9APIA|nr:hypothetical protein POM88_034686 [Heracleum sosnowskyi]
MWSTADCTTKGEIKFIIKGNSYTLTPSVINEALHLPSSNEETRDGIPVVEPLSSEEEKSKHSLLLFLPDPAVKPGDRQHLLDAAAVFKYQLVTRLTSCAEKLRIEEMIILADECHNTIEDLGDDYTSFSTEVNKLISQHQELAFASKKKENWNEGDIMRLFILTKCSYFLKEELTSALLKLTAETNADYLKLEREELTSALLKITEELSVEEERVKTLTVERDQCHDAQSAVEAELSKMEAEKEEAHVTFKVINDRYDAAKKEFDRMTNHILLLVRNVTLTSLCWTRRKGLWT